MATKSQILGIDPGISGAMAIIDPHTNLVKLISDFPLHPKGAGGKNVIDASDLAQMIEPHIPHVAFAVVEDVHAMPGQGVTSMFTFGVAKGLIIGVLSAFKCPIFFVPPGVWKSCYGLSANKSISIELAVKKYPDAAGMLTRKKDDGRAEALLLADFGRRFI